MGGNPTQTSHAKALWAAFEGHFGVPPEGVWGAPGRANLIGEHTDYNNGLALPFGIAQQARVAVRRRQDDALCLVSKQMGVATLRLSDIFAGKVSGWSAYAAGAVWVASQQLGTNQGVDLLLDSDVPAGAGLSSSAALECAIVLAMAELSGLEADRPTLARLAQRAEVEIAGVPCGLMDQLTSMCAHQDQAMMVDFRSMDVEYLPLPLDEAGLALLVVDTRAPHHLASGQYAERRASCQQAARTLGHQSLRDSSPAELASATSCLGALHLRRARHVVSENARVLCCAAVLREAGEQGPQQLRRLGPFLSRSHASLRDDFEVSVPELNLAAQTAEECGALGARLIGGGFGGSVLCLVRKGQLPVVLSGVERAFRDAGFAAPAGFEVAPRAGAQRLL